MASNIPGKEFTIPKPHQIAKSKNFEKHFEPPSFQFSANVRQLARSL